MDKTYTHRGMAGSHVTKFNRYRPNWCF